MCCDCGKEGSDGPTLKAIILELKQDLAKLQEQILSCKRTISGDDTYEDMISEMRDREKRKFNVILFGVAESDAVSSTERQRSDSEQCQNLLRELSVDCQVPPVRLGKPRQGQQKPRPIRLTFETEHLVHEVIRKAKKLNQSRSYNGIRVSFDRTPRQIQYYNTVRTELQARIAEGELLRIRYVRGIPKITPLN